MYKSQKKLIKFWEGVAETSFHWNSENAAISDRYWSDLIFATFSRWAEIKQGMKVLKLDLYNEATWTNYCSYFMKKGIEVHAIEICPSTIKKAEKKMKEQNFEGLLKPVAGDFRGMPYRDNTFDLIVSFGSIEHVPEWRKELEEQFRILKHGGMIIVGVPNLFNIFLRPIFMAFFDRIGVLEKCTNLEINFPPRRLENALKSIGFENIEISGYHLFPKQLRWLDLWTEENIKINKLLKIKRTIYKPILDIFKYIELKNTKS